MRQLMVTLLVVAVGLLLGYSLALYGSTGMLEAFLAKLPGCW